MRQAAIAQMVERRVSDRKVANPSNSLFDSRTGSAYRVFWNDFLCLFPIGASSLIVVVA